MGIFKLFSSKDSKTKVANAEVVAQPNENGGMQDNKVEHIRTITYVTGLPIDVVYDSIGRDNDEKGFGDAMVSLDSSYLETGRNLIKNDICKIIEQTILKYKDDIKQLDTMIAYNDSMGMAVSVSNLKTKKEVYVSHIDEMNIMKKQLDDLSATTMNSIRSYERGFMRGITAKTELVLKGC